MKLKKYSKYKKSGIDWIGEIPEGWSVDKVKHLADFRKYYPIGDGDHGSIKPEMYQDEGIPYVRVQNLSWDGTMKLDDIVYISNEVNLANKKSILKEGDLLIAKTGATVGKLGLLNEKIKIANTTSSVGKITFDKKKHYPNFWKYSFQGKVLQDQILITAYQKSAQPGFNIDDLVEFNVITPPIQTQQKISIFLDSKTAQIEKLIEKDRNLIELLKEKRVSLINQSVTKGIKKNVKMKNSGVEWIGEIPENWSVRKLSQCFDLIGSGTTPTSGDDFYHENGTINWLLTGDLNDGHIEDTTKKVTINAVRDYSALKLHPEKSLVIAMYGATIGKIGLTKIKTTTNQACCVLNKSNVFNIRFTFYRFLAKKKEIISLSYGGGQPNISQDIIKNLKIQVPTIKEQQEIVEFLDKETVKIDNHIKKVERRIELYEEYKKSLIYNVVTGKVEV